MLMGCFQNKRTTARWIRKEKAQTLFSRDQNQLYLTGILQLSLLKSIFKQLSLIKKVKITRSLSLQNIHPKRSSGKSSLNKPQHTQQARPSTSFQNKTATWSPSCLASCTICHTGKLRTVGVAWCIAVKTLHELLNKSGSRRVLIHW